MYQRASTSRKVVLFVDINLEAGLGQTGCSSNAANAGTFAILSDNGIKLSQDMQLTNNDDGFGSHSR